MALDLPQARGQALDLYLRGRDLGSDIRNLHWPDSLLTPPSASLFARDVAQVCIDGIVFRSEPSHADGPG
jgi:hypothetical protein